MKIIFALLFALPAFAGNESGGGGGVLYGGPQPILVDFLNIDANFKDTNTYQKWNASRIDVNSNPKMELTRDNESLERANNQALDLALTIIEKWETMFLDIAAGNIHTAIMFPLKWSFKNQSLSAPDSYLPLPNISRENIKTAAYYLKNGQSFAVQISTPIWNELGVVSQAGLLVHETLRHLQIGWSNDFNEESLQKATALVMMCKPHSSINQYLFYITQNRSDLADALVGRFEDILKNYCVRSL